MPPIPPFRGTSIPTIDIWLKFMGNVGKSSSPIRGIWGNIFDARILRVSREVPRMSLRVAAMAGIQPWGLHMGVEPKIMVPQNGWFIRENPIEMDDLGVLLFLETPIFKPYEM